MSYCDRPFCSNNPSISKRSFEYANGEVCDACQDAAEAEEYETETCSVCGEYRRDHKTMEFCLDAEEEDQIPVDDEQVKP